MAIVCETTSHRRNIPFGRGILMSFCDSFRFGSASSFSLITYTYVTYIIVIFMSRREISNYQDMREQNGKKIHSISTISAYKSV